MKKSKLAVTRKEKGYTQQQVADFIPTDVSNYSRKESGDVRIAPEEWEKIARFLNVSIEEIYEEEDVKPIINNTCHDITPPFASRSVTDFNEISLSIIKNLQEYIELLKDEITRLKDLKQSRK
jgi:transcriptional regulator with XRE-family HTH domain